MNHRLIIVCENCHKTQRYKLRHGPEKPLPLTLLCSTCGKPTRINAPQWEALPEEAAPPPPLPPAQTCPPTGAPSRRAPPPAQAR